MSRAALFRKHKAKVIILIIVLVGALGTLVVFREANPPVEPKVAAEQTDTVIENDLIRYPGESGVTALALLKRYAQTKTEAASFGEYVVSINGHDGGGEKFWLFYINGQPSGIGAGSYETKTGDTIEWRLE